MNSDFSNEELYELMLRHLEERDAARVALEELTAAFTNLRFGAEPVYEANVFVKAVQHFELAFDGR